MNTTPRYTAHCERDETGWWTITVPELPGVVTQARRLDQIDDLVTDVIRLWLNEPKAKFTIVHDIAGTAQALDVWADAHRMRELARQLQRDVATTLTAELGLTLRDAATLLEISHQRVAQLVEDAEHHADNLNDTEIVQLVDFIQHRVAQLTAPAGTRTPQHTTVRVQRARAAAKKK